MYFGGTPKSARLNSSWRKIDPSTRRSLRAMEASKSKGAHGMFNRINTNMVATSVKKRVFLCINQLVSVNF